MTEIDYGRLSELEFALGGRAAIEHAYRTGVPLLGAAGGASAKSSILAWSSRSQAGALLAFVAGDVVKDDIGLSIDAGSNILLPKGFYSASLFVNPLDFPTDQGGGSDEWDLALYSIQAGGLTTNAPFPPNPNQGPVVYQSISGTAASIANQALQTAFLFESGEQDVHSVIPSVAAGTFAMLSFGLSAADVTTGHSLWAGQVGYTETFHTQVLLQLHRLSKT